MILDRAHGNAQGFRGLTVAVPASHQSQDFELARRERIRWIEGIERLAHVLETAEHTLRARRRAPAVVHSTLGSLVLLSLYDLARFAFPARWYETLWLYEHLVKMIGAHGSAITAFSSTVLWAWQPYSQLVPLMLWVAAMIGRGDRAACRARTVGGSRLRTPGGR